MNNKYFLIIPIIIMTLLFTENLYAPSYTSYASWYDAGGVVHSGQGGDECFVSIYCLQNNTDISLYRVSTEDTSITTLIASWTGVAAGTPLHPVAMNPNGNGGYGQSFFRLVATNALSGVNLVNWELEAADFNTYPDSHTFVVSTNGTMLGTQFYTYLFHDNNNPGDNTEGMSIAVFNPGTGAITATVERWNGASWVAAPATATGGNVGNIPAGKIWMYGGVTSATSGDFRITITGGSALVYKGNVFTADYDNNFLVAAGSNGSKIGRDMYGCMGGPNWGSDGRGSMVVNAIGGASSYSIYYYTYSGNPKFPATTAGTWNLWTSDTCAAGSSKIYAFGKDGLPDPGSGRPLFVRVVVNSGADIQVETGQNMLAGKSGDGDFLVAADTRRPIGTLFYPTNAINGNGLGLSGGDVPNRIVVIAPYAGTTVQVSSPGWGTFNWTSTADHQAHSWATMIDPYASAINRIYTVTSSKPIYCFYETQGSADNEMEKCYSAVAPIPGPDLKIQKSVNDLHGNPGQTVTYIITYKNVGADAANNTIVWDTIPLGMTVVYDSASGSVSQPGTPGVSPRIWNMGITAADGLPHSITLAVRLNDTDLGTHIYYNTASINCQEVVTPVTSDPTLTLSVNRPQANWWKSYGVWEDKPPSGSQNEGYLHIYGLRDGTTVRLQYSSSTDSSAAPMTINTMESGFPTTINAGQVIDVGPINTKFYKIEADYPVLWEFDSINVADKSGHSMEPYSTDYRLSDNKAFFTYMDYYHKTGCGTPDCPNTTRVGDVLGIINTSLTNNATVIIYNSLDNGVTWNNLGTVTIAPESIYLYGGTTQAMAGDYMVVSVKDATTNGGENIIVYKGSEIGIDPYWNTSNQGMNYAISEKGQKADNTRLYGTCSTSDGYIVVTAVSGNPSYQIYRYVPTSGASTSWPITGNSGTWQLVTSGGPLTTGGAPGVHSISQKGFYKVVVTGGGYVQAAMGGRILHTWAQGDGDYVGSVDHMTEIGFTYPTTNYTHLDIGTNFYVSTDGGNGLIEVIMPEAGTTVQITGSLQGGLGSMNNNNPAASTANDQAYRFYTNGTNSTFRIQANKNVIVQFQDQDNDHQAKAFAGSPLFIASSPTPTPTGTNTNTPTPTNTRTNTPTNTITNTFTNTPTVTSTFTPTNTITNTVTNTPTNTRTNTPTNTITNTFTSTYTDTQTNTITNTFTSTFTNTPTNTPTNTFTSTITNTRTDTPTNTFTNTATNTRTDTPTNTLTFTPTVTGTPPPTWTFTDTATNTFTFTITNTRTHTFTFTSTNTPTGTNTPTDTGTNTATNTATNTRTDTPTNTLTFTPTVTGTPPPTWTFTDTATNTFTFTITNTRTPTSTNTITNTQTDTNSPTTTNSPTNTNTRTDTATATFTNTPSNTFTVTNTRTYTFTSTNTSTPTETYTPSNTPTITNTFTITMTPPETPYKLAIYVYNSAGEKVRTIIETAIDTGIEDVLMTPEDGKLFVGNELKLEFKDAVTSKGEPAIFTWYGDNDSGQMLKTGVYYIKIETADGYGHYSNLIKEISVINSTNLILLTLYNTAGEIVRQSRIESKDIASKLTVLNAADDVYLLNNSNRIMKVIYGDNPDDYITVDLMQENQSVLNNGQYIVKIESINESSPKVTIMKQITILKDQSKLVIENFKAYPNPLLPGKGDLKLYYKITGDFSNAYIKIYNLVGELIRIIPVNNNEAIVLWDKKTASGQILSAGTYIAILEIKSIDSVLREKIKINLY